MPLIEREGAVANDGSSDEIIDGTFSKSPSFRSFKEPLAPESCAPLVKSLSALNNAGASQSEEDT
jgi:hypothetical protein